MGWPADVPASAHLFVATAADLTDCLEVAGEDGHHLARVLRLRPGEVVTVADGAGTWRPYRVGAADGPADPFHPDGGARPARPPGAAAVRLDAAGGGGRGPALPLPPCPGLRPT